MHWMLLADGKLPKRLQKLSPLTSVVMAMEMSNDKITGGIEREVQNEAQTLTANASAFYPIGQSPSDRRRLPVSLQMFSFKNLLPKDLLDAFIKDTAYSVYKEFEEPFPKTSLIRSANTNSVFLNFRNNVASVTAIQQNQN